jgi:hypothetical protein
MAGVAGQGHPALGLGVLGAPLSRATSALSATISVWERRASCNDRNCSASFSTVM